MNRWGFVLVASLVLSSLALGREPAGNWPRWRGPNADGVADGRSVPIRWSQTENVRWSVKVAGDLDFVSVHLYPRKGQLDEALKTLAGFAVGKPVLVEETFPLACSPKELEQFIDGSKEHAAGWIGFYWGKPPEELRRSNTISDALTLGWLELFQKRTKALEQKAPK